MFKRIAFLAFVVFAIHPLRASADNTKPSVAVTSIHQWVTGRMVSWMPPGRSLVKDARETPDEGRKRYEEIADALISVVYNPQEKAIFGGKYGRARTLSLILSVAWFESGFRKDVDLGVGPLSRGDSGQSWCMMQIMLGPAGIDGNTKRRIVIEGNNYKISSDPNEGWGGLDLVSDRTKCFKVGITLIRKSFLSCTAIPIEDRLSVYGAGKCIANWQPSRYRVKKAQEWMTNDKPPMTDEEVVNLLLPNPSNASGVNVTIISNNSDRYPVFEPPS